MPSNSSGNHPGCDSTEQWFDRTICPDPCGSMHTVCSDCGYIFGGCANFTELPTEPFARAATVIERFIFSHVGVPWSAADVAEALVKNGVIEGEPK